jgi:hypothetical protein
MPLLITIILAQNKDKPFPDDDSVSSDFLFNPDFAKLPRFRILILTGLSEQGNHFEHCVDESNR